MKVRRTLLPSLAFLGIASLLFATQQQPPTPQPAAPVAAPNGVIAIAPQQIDPPEPPQGQGAELKLHFVDARTGNGLPGVAIELRRRQVTPQPAQLLAQGLSTAQIQALLQNVDRRRWSYMTTTDTRGLATVSNVIADAYTIMPMLDGYKLADGSTDTVTLAAAAKPDPLTLRMWKAVSIEGTVVDPDKNPVAGAAVELLTEGWVGGVRTMALPQPAVLTDAAGAFKFPAIISGTYYMRARPPAALIQQQLKTTADKPVAFVNTMYPSAQYMEQAAQIIVNEVNLFGVRVELQSSPYFTLSGRVFDIPPDIKYSGLVLMRRVSFDSPFPFLAANPYDGAFNTELKPDGSFTTPNLPPGPYWAGYTPAGPIRGGTQFLLADRNVENAAFSVVPGLTFSGRAVYEDGTPVERGKSASLGIFAANMGVYPRSFTIGANGEFSASGLPMGSYRMDFADGLVIKKVELNAHAYSGGDFDLNETPPAPAVITLSRKGGGIQGSVTLLPQAKSYARGLVTIAKQPFRATDTVRRKYLDGKLDFNVEHLEVGHYRVCAWLEEGSEVDRVLDNPMYEKRLAGLCEVVELSGDEKKQVLLRQLTTVDFKD